MGVDAMIAVQTVDGKEPDFVDFPVSGVSVERNEGRWDLPAGAQFDIDGLGRYWAPFYERGHWPNICAVLMTLLTAKNVAAVWYGGDCDAPEAWHRVTPELLAEYTGEYLGHERVPWR